MPRWDTDPLNDPSDPRIKAARRLLRGGYLTMAEAADLLGFTRQYVFRLTHDLQPVQRRAAYLKQLWRKTLEGA